MKTELIQTLTSSFESHSHQTKDGISFWFARDLQKLLGYERWENFFNVITKAKTSCETSHHMISDHFRDVTKMVTLGSNSQRQVDDIMLTRYACYLIAQNGNPQKSEIAFAQTYFAIQTRRAELIEQRLHETERVSARKKLSATEKALSQIIYEQTGSDKNFGIIRNKGDLALFNKSNKAMKIKWEVPANRPLADFAPTIVLKAKDFASEITAFNAKEHKMKTENAISHEHVTNNKEVRETLLRRGIYPEKLPAAEDIKQTEKRLSTEKKKSLKKPEVL